MKNKNVYKITLGGICLALTLVFMFAASIVPGAELTLYAVSSLFIAVMIIETGVKGGAALYAAAVLLGILIIPNKIGVLPYACVFGLYGIVKFYIEKAKSPVLQVLLKIMFFAAVLVLAFTGLKGLLLGSVQLPDMPAAVLIIAGVLFMLLYDLIYTLLIRIYRQRFKREKKISFHLSGEDEKEK